MSAKVEFLRVTYMEALSGTFNIIQLIEKEYKSGNSVLFIANRLKSVDHIADETWECLGTNVPVYKITGEDNQLKAFLDSDRAVGISSTLYMLESIRSPKNVTIIHVCLGFVEVDYRHLMQLRGRFPNEGSKVIAITANLNSAAFQKLREMINPDTEYVK